MSEKRRILVLIDWDNLWLNLLNIFGPENVRISHRFDELKKWLRTIGEIFAVFVFAPPFLSPIFRKIIREQGFYLVACDKIEKTADEEGQLDTVDEALMKFGELMLDHPDINYLCLVSGDDDFIPLLRKAEEKGIKKAIAVASIHPLSRNLVPLADRHPATQKKMILRINET